MLVYEKYSEIVEVKCNHVSFKPIFTRKYIPKLPLKYSYLGMLYIYSDAVCTSGL